jgi:hypothetical protein
MCRLWLAGYSLPRQSLSDKEKGKKMEEFEGEGSTRVGRTDAQSHSMATCSSSCLLRETSKPLCEKIPFPTKLTRSKVTKSLDKSVNGRLKNRILKEMINSFG